MNLRETFLTVKGLKKSFGTHEVLKGINLSFTKGKITALIGANGAGKSTLMKALSGRLPFDDGEVEVAGRFFSSLSSAEVKEFGINLIPQELDLIPHLNARQNILLGLERGLPFSEYSKNLRKKMELAIESLGLKLPRHREVAQLSPSQQQLVAIAKALVRESKFLILDEPTSMLTSREIEKLFLVLKGLREKGVTLVYISHRMHEIFEITDEMIVLKDGLVTGAGETALLSESQIIEWMVGQELPPRGEFFSKRNKKFDNNVTPALEVKNLSNGSLKNIHLNVRPGEILGVLGLMGSGRTELLRALAGIDSVHEGEFWINGILASIHSVSEAMAQGIYLAPEDRRGSGLFLQQSVGFNTHIVNLDRFRGPMGSVNQKLEKACYEKAKALVSLKVHDYRYPAQQLSGGNQQRLILSKILLRKAKILLVDEATAGVDVMTKNEIREKLWSLTDDGISIIFVSSEWSEVMAIADRALVLYEGNIVKELAPHGFDEREVLSSILEFSAKEAAGDLNS